jgi:hypothetical protein
MSEEEINEKAGFNLSEILKEESEKTKGSFFDSRIYNEDEQVRETLCAFIIAEHTNKFSLEALQSVLSAIDRIRKARYYNPRFVLSIFKTAIYKLQAKLEALQKTGEKEDDISAGRCEVIIDSIKFCAERFAYYALKEEIKDLSRLDKLKSLKRTLSEKTFQNKIMLRGEDAAIYKALLELLEEVETELRLEKEKIAHLKDLEILSATELTENEPSQGKHIVDRNQRQVFLALQIIIRYLGGAGDTTDNANLMSFLSGYSAESMRQHFSKSEPQSDGNLLGYWKNKKVELERVRQIFIDCKLQKLAKFADEQIRKM